MKKIKVLVFYSLAHGASSLLRHRILNIESSSKTRLTEKDIAKIMDSLQACNKYSFISLTSAPLILPEGEEI